MEELKENTESTKTTAEAIDRLDNCVDFLISELDILQQQMNKLQAANTSNNEDIIKILDYINILNDKVAGFDNNYATITDIIAVKNELQKIRASNTTMMQNLEQTNGKLDFIAKELEILMENYNNINIGINTMKLYKRDYLFLGLMFIVLILGILF